VIDDVLLRNAAFMTDFTKAREDVRRSLGLP
jgi:hypothetical protein